MIAGDIVDSHHHLWDTDEVHYALFDEVTELRRPYRLAEFEADSAPLGVQAAICVEAASAGADGRVETEWLHRHVTGSGLVAALVAWAPLDRRDLGAHLDWLLSLSDPPIVGVRRSFEFEPPDYAGQPVVAAGARAAGERGLVVDLVLFAGSLQATIALVDRCPQTQFVLDHLGKPPIRARRREPWASQLAELALRPNVAAKLSGLAVEADLARWTTDDLRPYVEHAVSCFGPQRLLYGSDWPVVNRAGGTRRWLRAVSELLADLPADDRRAVLADNSCRVYGIRAG